MLKNYLKIIIRHITKNIVYVLINVLGLGLALAVCIVAYLNYKFDADFDISHEHRDLVFRIEHIQLIEGNQKSYASSPGPLGPAVVADISGIEKMVRVTMDLMSNVQLLKAGEDEIYTRLIYTDPGFFDLFTFPLISGSKESFHDNNSIFITQHLATVLFGDNDPVGEIIYFMDSPYSIGAVLENHPLNSSFSFNAVVPIYNSYSRGNNSMYNWNDFVSSTFILVKDQRQTEVIEKSLQRYVPVVNDNSWNQVERFYLAPFKNMAHKGRNISDHPFRPGIHPAAVFPPLIAAICILMIACFNFTNTTIALAGKRLKETGIRKVVGSTRRQLILQYLGENILLVLFALIFALFFAHFLVPSYSAMWDFMDLSISLTRDPALWVFIMVILIATAIISGAYPAFIISGFNPVNILQEKFKIGGSSILSKAILTLQIGISVLALFTGVAFIQNAEYQDSFDIGYDGAHLIEVHGDPGVLPVFKNAIRGNPDIENMSDAILAPFFNTRDIKYNETILQAKMKFFEMESFNTLGLRLLEGRSFEPETKKTDEIGSILVNREFIEEIGMVEPVGKTVMMSDTIPLTIIGVIENLLDEGVFSTTIPPVFYRLSNDSNKAHALWVRVAPENRQDLQTYLKEEWNKVVPDYPFLGIEGNIFNEAAEYINRKILIISFFLVLIASLISAAGLFSQVSLRIIHRTKEIGIRKIFGASIPGVIRMLNYEFLILFATGSILGIISGYYLNVELMDSIWKYSTDLTIITFIVPVVIFLSISIITVSGKVYHAATRNPAHSLRYE